MPLWEYKVEDFLLTIRTPTQAFFCVSFIFIAALSKPLADDAVYRFLIIMKYNRKSGPTPLKAHVLIDRYQFRLH